MTLHTRTVLFRHCNGVDPTINDDYVHHYRQQLEPKIRLARRRAVDVDVAVGGGLVSLRTAFFKRRVMVGRTSRARRHNQDSFTL